MASTNQSPFYKRAEAEFHEATTDEERIACLEIMIKECPKHKSSEKMLKNLTLRLKKLKENVIRKKKSKKSTRGGIKKGDIQCVIAGFPNTGKSTLFKTLTGQESKISPHEFTTNSPQLGTFLFENTKIQIIDSPAFPYHDKSIINATDTLLILVTSINQIPKLEEFIYRSKAKIILIYSKIDLYSEIEKRKIEANLKSKFKQFDHILISPKDPPVTELNQLRKKIFETFPIIRIYTKEPKKIPSIEPMIMKEGSTIKDSSEKILKGMSKLIKRAKVWGPSSKFGGQIVGMDHILKDKDIVEFQTS